MHLLMTALSVQDNPLVVWPAVAVALGTCIGLLWKVLKGFKDVADRGERIWKLTDHELNHNSGSSTKDAAFAAATAAAEAANSAAQSLQVIQGIGSQFNTFLQKYSDDQVSLWKSINHQGEVNGIRNAASDRRNLEDDRRYAESRGI